MNTDDFQAILHEAAQVRIPRRGEDGLQKHIERLEDYLLETAFQRGALEEARLLAHEALKELRHKWSELTGYEMHLPRGHAAKPTKEAVIEAKRKTRPDLYAAMEDARWWVDRFTDQIKRLIADDAATSRAYTLATGS